MILEALIKPANTSPNCFFFISLVVGEICLLTGTTREILVMVHASTLQYI